MDKLIWIHGFQSLYRNNMWNGICFKPTQSHRVPEAGIGQTNIKMSRWGKMGCGSETRPTEDKSNAPFIKPCHARPGKDRRRRVQEQGSKGEAKWGRNEKAWGGSGRTGSAGVLWEVRKEKWWGAELVELWLFAFVCDYARVPDLECDGVVGELEMMKGPRGRWVKMIKQPPTNQTY